MTPSSAALPVSFSLDPEGLGWIVFDAPGTKTNVFNAETLRALEIALDIAERHSPRAIIITGTKDRIFIAGADLKWLQELPDVDAAEAFSRRGQLLFDRVAASRVPVIAAIQGACAGGGYELALACDWRIASDAAVTQLGLPEVSIGTIPGWGGCVRLPRLIGVNPALDHIVKGQLCTADEARKLGLVDEIVPVTQLHERAKEAALRLAAGPRPVRSIPAAPPVAQILSRRKNTILRTRGQLPAAVTAIDLIQQTHALPVAAALAAEAKAFGEITAGIVCKNLVHVFFLRDAAKKRTLDGWYDTPPSATARIRKVGVVGAGVMGSGIAHWLACRGFEVVLRDVKPEFIERARGVIHTLLQEGIKRGMGTAADVQEVIGRIRTTTDWAGFTDCDLVIEAIVEDVAAKRRLFSELVAIVSPDAILASNTSALPIEEISAGIKNPERVIGIHFFNPVSRMPLVELILGRNTGSDVAARALQLVRTLGKSPVICRSSPGFLVTRVLFFYLNAAVSLWEAGLETVEIDGAMREYGWPMGPLRLIDEVGLDVTAFIFGEMAHYFPERFRKTTACDTLLAAALAGRKNGAGRGFYRYVGSDQSANDAETRPLCAAPRRTSDAASSPSGSIIDQLMRVMVAEARQCLAEGVVRSAADVDFALLSGAGFPAFRGGLLRWAADLGREARR